MTYLDGLYINKNPKTHLIDAVEAHDNDTVQYILNAATNVKLYAQKLDMNVALQSSIARQNQTAFEALLKAGADINHTDNGRRSPLFFSLHDKSRWFFDRLIELGADISLTDCYDETLLMRAVEANNLQAVETFIALGIDLDARNRHGTTALFVAAEQGNDHCLNALIQAGANIHIVTSIMDFARGSYLLSPFFVAIKEGHLECVKLLIEAGVDIFETTDKLGSAWDWASSLDRHEIIEYLNAHCEQRSLCSLVSSSKNSEAESALCL